MISVEEKLKEIESDVYDHLESIKCDEAELEMGDGVSRNIHGKLRAIDKHLSNGCARQLELDNPILLSEAMGMYDSFKTKLISNVSMDLLLSHYDDLGIV